MRNSPSLTRRIKWRLEYVAYLVMETTVGCLGLRLTARVGAALGGWGGRWLKSRRRIVRRNLRIAFAGEKTLPEIDALTDEVFRRAGANLVASLRTATLDDAGLARAIEVENPEVFADSFADGRGVVVMLAHMGNWEALAQMFPRMIPAGVRVGDIYRPLSNPLMDERLQATRRRQGLELIEKGASPFALAAFVKDGGALGVMSDQRAEAAGEILPYFGRLTSCTPLPSLLARRSGAKVVAISLRTLEPGRWRLKLHRLEGEPTTAACMALLETVIRESPADVFWLQDRWRLNRRSPLLVNGKLARGVDPQASVKRRRTLVWLGGDLANAPELPGGEPDDLSFEYALPAGVARPGWLAADAVVWTRRRGDTRDEVCADLQEIDGREVLPLEIVVAAEASSALVKACRRLGMGLVREGDRVK